MEPTFEQAPEAGDQPRPGLGEVADGTNIEQAPSSRESVGSSSGVLPVVSAVPGQQPAQGMAAVPAAGGVTTPAATGASNDDVMIADDADLIEKEWVNRAKAVVEQTKADPYAQNKALGKVKADYIKKRYNKDIRMSE